MSLTRRGASPTRRICIPEGPCDGGDLRVPYIRTGGFSDEHGTVPQGPDVFSSQEDVRRKEDESYEGQEQLPTVYVLTLGIFLVMRSDSG